MPREGDLGQRRVARLCIIAHFEWTFWHVPELPSALDFHVGNHEEQMEEGEKEGDEGGKETPSPGKRKREEDHVHDKDYRLIEEEALSQDPVRPIPPFGGT